MTFCFFSAQYLPTVGGVERYTASLAKKLIQNGHKVVVVTSSLKGKAMYEIYEGVHVYRVPSVPLLSGRLPFAVPFIKWYKIKKHLKKLNINFITVQTRLYPLSLLGVNFAKHNKIKHIVVEHGAAHLINGGIVGKMCGIYEHALMALVKRGNTQFFGVSKAATNWLCHFNISTNNTLYNAVNPNELCKKANETIQKYGNEKQFINMLINKAKKQERGQTNLPTQQFTDENETQPLNTIAFSGRFIPEKGIMPLIQAFKNIQNKHKNAVLLIGGGGPQQSEIQQNLPQNAYIVGMLTYEENLAFIKSADIFCLPSFSEGFSTTVLEAAALKTAIITTNTGGSPELILNSEHGIIIEDTNVQTIEKALDEMLSNNELRKIMTQKTYEVLCNNFTWNSVCEKLTKTALQ